MKSRPLLLLYGVVFCIMLIFNSTFTLLPVYLIRLGGTPFLAGLQTALFFAASIALRFYFGPLADRIGRKIPLLIGVGCFTLSSFLFMQTNQVWLIGLVRLVQAIGLSAFLSSSMSAVADWAPTGKLGAVMGVYRLVSTLSLLAGPALAWQVVSLSHENTWFAVCAAVGLLAFLLLLLVPFMPVSSRGHIESKGLMWRVVFQPSFRLIYLGIALSAASYGALLSFASLHISAVTQVANPGVYFIFFGVSSLFFTFLSGHLSDQWGRAAVAWPSLIILGLGVALLALLERGQMTVLFISSFLTGVGFNGGLSVLSAWLVDQSAPDQRATVLSVQESIIDFSIGVIAFAFGSFSVSTDFSTAFLMTGLFIAGMSGFLSLANRRASLTNMKGG